MVQLDHTSPLVPGRAQGARSGSTPQDGTRPGKVKIKFKVKIKSKVKVKTYGGCSPHT